MKKIDTLIISGASITASPWFTWADIVEQIIQPNHTINISARGTGNYYIALSCINTILKNNLSNTLCMPMFTAIDKFNMYLDTEKTKQLIHEKHPPVTLNGQSARADEYSFWSTGSHWPLIKQGYRDNFFNTDIACTNTILMFFALDNLCKQRNIDLIPLFDMNIWNYTEQAINEHVVHGTPLVEMNLVDQPLTKTVKTSLDKHWFEFVSLIQFALNNNLPIYNSINKLHPPSYVHYKWVNYWINPMLSERFICHTLDKSFIKKIQVFSGQWKKNY